MGLISDVVSVWVVKRGGGGLFLSCTHADVSMHVISDVSVWVVERRGGEGGGGV